MSRWERDETLPETEKVVALADLFGVTTEYLLRPEAETAERTRREKSNRFLAEHGASGNSDTDTGLGGGGLGRTGPAAFSACAAQRSPDAAVRRRHMSHTMMVVLTTLMPRILLAALKIALGIALIRFGKRYEQDKKERR